MRSVTLSTEVEFEISEVIDQIDEENLAEELRNRGYEVFSQSSDFSDQSLIDECAKRAISIMDTWNSNDQEDNILFMTKVVDRMFQFL